MCCETKIKACCLTTPRRCLPIRLCARYSVVADARQMDPCYQHTRYTTTTHPGTNEHNVDSMPHQPPERSGANGLQCILPGAICLQPYTRSLEQRALK